MNKQIIEEAAEWFVEFNTGEPERATKQAFDEWLRKSPEHVRAYLELLPMWEDAAAASSASSVSADELIAMGRRPDNLIAWSGPRDSTEPSDVPRSDAFEAKRRARHFGSSALRFTLAASLVLIFVVGGIFWSQSLRGEVYTTGIGEQRTIPLADGSTVELNTDSRVRVLLSDHRRDVELAYGQALFHVAKDAARPFIVASSRARIRAVGTEFDVYRQEAGTTVTVLEGKVAVLSDVGPDDLLAPKGTPVSAGEQLTISAPIVIAQSAGPKRANVAAATAWTQHRLLFESTPLPEVVAEFNRYNRRRLIIEGRVLDNFNVSGSFASADPASLLRFLEAQPGLVVREATEGIYISKQ
jgi:transmembrane sensor